MTHQQATNSDSAFVDPNKIPPKDETFYWARTNRGRTIHVRYDPYHGIFYYGEDYMETEIGWIDNGEGPELVIGYSPA